MDLDYIRALYPPGGEHLGDDPTLGTKSLARVRRCLLCLQSDT
jgi:hypothetical protein